MIYDQNFWFLTKIFDFWPKFRSLTKVLGFDLWHLKYKNCSEHGVKFVDPGDYKRCYELQ